MKYNEIYNFDDLRAYCKVCNKSYKIFNPTSPKVVPNTPNNLMDLYHSPSKALGYRLFETPIVYFGVAHIKGVIYSYYTPIGFILRDSIIIVQSSQLPFKSVTTKKLVTILNRNTIKMSLLVLVDLLKVLNIDLGWLE